MSRRLGLTKRLMLILIALVIPLLAVQSAMVVWGRSAIQTELESAARNNVTYLRDMLDDQVTSLNAQLESLVNQPSVVEFYVYNHYGTYTTAQYYSAIRAIYPLLGFMRTSNALLTDVRLYYPEDKRCLTSREETFAYDDSETFVAPLRACGGLLTELDDRLVSGFLYPTTAFGADVSPKIIAVATFDPDALRGLLSAYGAYSDSNAFLLYHPAGTAHASVSGQERVGEELLARIAPSSSGQPASTSLTLDGESVLAVSCYSSLLDCTFVQLVPMQRISAIPNRLLQFMIAFVALTLLVILAYSFVAHRLVQEPIDRLTEAFRLEGQGDLSVRVPTTATREFRQLGERFNDMSARLETLVERNYTQTILLQRAELKQLQAQINPHFFYNSFFLLKHLVSGAKREEAIRLTRYLGEYFRYISENARSTHTLASEYGHAATYMQIQQMRFGATARMEIEPLPDALRDTVVPRLILQPLLENSIEHGVPTTKPVSVMRMRFADAESDVYTIVVEDNGDRLQAETIAEIARRLDAPDAEAHALVNIHRRIRLYFGAPCGLRVGQSELGGLRVEMRMRKEVGTDA